jgi:ABC-2 type transport system ATP-binding protein
VVNGLAAPRLGELAASGGVVLHELTPAVGSLEDAYLTLTQDDVEYHARGVDAAVPSSANAASGTTTNEGAVR